MNTRPSNHHRPATIAASQSEPLTTKADLLSANIKPLRVLQIHNFYQQKGGEDVVVCNEALLLQQAGVEVHTWYVDSASLLTKQGWLKKLQLLTNLFWNFSAQRQLKALLRTTPVDIIHLHNSFPLLSPAIIHTARKLGVPVVMTVHNFRWCHPSGSIQQVADVLQSPWQLLGKRLYRHSRLATALLIGQIQLHRKLGSYSLCQKLLCPSLFVKEALLCAGYPEAQLLVKAHSVASLLAEKAEQAEQSTIGESVMPPQSATTSELHEPFVLYVGRADTAKGLYFLLQTWQQIDYPLCIVGVTEQQAKQWPGYQPHPKVRFVGPQSQADLARFYKQAQLLVVPSLVAETFGNVVVEAFCYGTPCLVSDRGALPELLYPTSAMSASMPGLQAACDNAGHMMAGDVFIPGDSADFIHKLTNILHNPQRLTALSIQARQQYLANYQPGQNQQALLACYHQVLTEQGIERSGSARSG